MARKADLLWGMGFLKYILFHVSSYHRLKRDKSKGIDCSSLEGSGHASGEGETLAEYSGLSLWRYHLKRAFKPPLGE